MHTLSRREMLLTLLCTAHAKIALSPASFPWAVDRTAHLARRETPGEVREPGELNFVLARLDGALSTCHTRPSCTQARLDARRQLSNLKGDIERAGMPQKWHEMHLFADILLRSEHWKTV
jgi:hypothetical protein